MMDTWIDRAEELSSEQLASRVRESLTCPLDDLVGLLPHSVLSAAGAGWRLPADDIAALTRCGVPVMPDRHPEDRIQLEGDIQRDPEPALKLPAIQAYRLGTYWRHVLGAVLDSGVVVGISGDPSDHFPINTSTARFVDVAWRWAVVTHFLSPLSQRDEDEDWALYDQCFDDFRQYFRRTDPEAAADTGYRFWRDIVNDYAPGSVSERWEGSY